MYVLHQVCTYACMPKPNPKPLNPTLQDDVYTLSWVYVYLFMIHPHKPSPAPAASKRPAALPEATREHLSSRRTPAHMYLHTPTIMRIHGTYVHGHRMYACVLCDEDVRVHHAHIDEDVHSEDLQICRLPQDLSIITARACSSAIAIGRTRFSWRFWHQRSAGHLVHSSERSHKHP